MSFRLGAPGDAGMVPLSLRETAKGGKKMIQLAALKQVSSFFQRSHPRAKRKPDPRIKTLPGGSSPLWDGGLKSEVMTAGRSLSLVYAMSEKGSENTCIIEKIRL